MDNTNIVYVNGNSTGYITAVNSSAFLTDPSEWVQIMYTALMADTMLEEE